MLQLYKHCDNMKSRTIIAVDFDNTITSRMTYPEIAPIRDGAKEVINRLAEKCCIVINTCREGSDLPQLKEWLRDNGIIYMHINKNCKWRIQMFSDTRKIGADIFIDDKCLHSYNRIDWYEIEKMVNDLIGK